jgi:hypothetical protein
MRRAKGMPNKALQQNRGDVLRYGESIGCDLLKAAVRQQEAQSQSRGAPSRARGVPVLAGASPAIGSTRSSSTIKR